MGAPPVGSYLPVADVMRYLVRERKTLKLTKPLMRAGISRSNYKRILADPEYHQSMRVETLERLLKGLGFDLMVCVGPASLIKVPPRG